MVSCCYPFSCLRAFYAPVENWPVAVGAVDGSGVQERMAAWGKTAGIDYRRRRKDGPLKSNIAYGSQHIMIRRYETGESMGRWRS